MKPKYKWLIVRNRWTGEIVGDKNISEIDVDNFCRSCGQALAPIKIDYISEKMKGE